MSEEQVKAADADAAKEEEEATEEISEEDLDGVVGGVNWYGGQWSRGGAWIQS